MRHGSLFSGIGGFDLAAEWMGWENVFQCEKDRFCQRILRFYWPNSKLYENVRQFDATIYRGTVDVISGGFPCQPFSIAGRRKGTEDDRFLWPEMSRIIREVRPRWIVGENVLGLLNWRRGLVFEQVLAELEVEGYTVWPYILPAAGAGAPHRRDRVWIIAHAGGHRRSEYPTTEKIDASRVEKGLGQGDDTYPPNGDGNVAHANRVFGQEGRLYSAQSETAKRYLGPRNARWDGHSWENFPSQSPICCRDDGLPCELDGISFSKWRDHSIAGFGNAIVPRIALEIFRTIETMERIEPINENK